MNNAARPIDCVPPELLCEIFEWSVGSCQEISPNNTPLSLLGVCKFWRVVALVHPRLWTEFSVTLSPDTLLPPPRTLQLWSSSMGTPNMNISLRIENAKIKSSSQLREARAKFQFLMNQVPSERWKSVELVLPASAYFLGGMFGECCPSNLESLRLDLHGWDTNGVQYLAPLLQNIPNLRRLDCKSTDHYGVAGTPTAPFLLKCNIPWRNLTQISLDVHTSFGSAYLILSQCEDLQVLNLFHFAMGAPVQGLTSRYGAVVLPHLHSMTIRQHTLDNGLATLFDMLACPNLKRVDIGVTDVFAFWPKDSFISLLERSPCQLQSIHFDRVGISEQELAQISQHNSTSLTELEVREMWGSICASNALLS